MKADNKLFETFEEASDYLIDLKNKRMEFGYLTIAQVMDHKVFIDNICDYKDSNFDCYGWTSFWDSKIEHRSAGHYILLPEPKYLPDLLHETPSDSIPKSWKNILWGSFYGLPKEHFNYIDKIGRAATYELLAEEAIELAHEAQKLARIYRNDNPTDDTQLGTYHKLVEEYSGLRTIMDDLEISPDKEYQKEKLKRFNQRIKAKRILNPRHS